MILASFRSGVLARHCIFCIVRIFRSVYVLVVFRIKLIIMKRAEYNIFFTALTLKGAKASETWDPESKASEDYQGGHKLVIRQALLGPEAKEGELNVVQVEAMTWKDSITIPVATLTAGPNGSSQCLLDLSFPDPPVTFSLLQGSGPVHIIGQHLIGSPLEEFDEMDDIEEEMLDDEEGEDAGVSNIFFSIIYKHIHIFYILT